MSWEIILLAGKNFISRAETLRVENIVAKVFWNASFSIQWYIPDTVYSNRSCLYFIFPWGTAMVTANVGRFEEVAREKLKRLLYAFKEEG